MESKLAGVATAAAACAASAAITISVAVADPAETSDALIASVIVGLAGLFTGRRIANAEHEAAAKVEKEPSIIQDPTQRRIDKVLYMVSMGTITAQDGERLIANLRTHPLDQQTPAPPYGTPEAH